MSEDKSRYIRIMKQLCVIIGIGCFAFSIKAQTLRQLIIEPSTARPGIYAESCPSPSLGILVFSSAIDGLEFGLSMSNMLINQRYAWERNEYVLCVQPTERGIVVMINSREYETATIRVENIIASTPQFFRINPKETAWSITGREFNILGESALNPESAIEIICTFIILQSSNLSAFFSNATH